MATVDGMEPCIGKIVGLVREVGDNIVSRTGTRKMPSRSSNTKEWFPFVEGSPFAATLWVGWEGFHMTINGKHITSYAYRQVYSEELSFVVKSTPIHP